MNLSEDQIGEKQCKKLMAKVIEILSSRTNMNLLVFYADIMQSKENTNPLKVKEKKEIYQSIEIC